MLCTPLGPVLVSLLSIVWLPAAAGEPAAGPAKTAAQAVAAQTTIDTPPARGYPFRLAAGTLPARSDRPFAGPAGKPT